MNIDTLRSYLSALDRIYVTEDADAWCPELRSKTTVRTSKRRYFSDPSVAAHCLGISAKDLEFDPKTFERLFETMVVRDLRVYVQSLDGEICHYRDKDGLEIDAVIQLRNGRWAAAEIRLGSANIDSAAKNLKKLKKKIGERYENMLSFLAVIVGTGIAYTREDGVHVIPVGCLRD